MIFTSRQIRFHDALVALEALSPYNRDDPHPYMVEYHQGLLAAILECAESEAEFRQAERYGVLGIETARSKLHSEAGERSNELAIRTLKRLVETSDSLVEVSGDYPKVKISREDEDISEFIDGWKRELAQVDIKTSDIEKLNAVFNDGLDALLSGQMSEISTYLRDQANRLLEARSSETRGSESNIPVWKLIALAAALGVTLAYFMHCRWRWYGRVCSYNTKRYYAALIAIGLGVTGYC